MTKRMLIDATHPEETRVAVVSGNRLEEYDFETVVRKQLKGNIYLVKVTRVEPSLQAAFVDFGGNRHGFLPFPEIHPDYYRIPIADREALIAEERAIAAAQAAREDAEDEAELAAAGESLDDEEEGDAAGEDAGEDYVPQHTGSVAADIETPVLSDDEDETEEEAEEEVQAATEDDTEAEVPAESGTAEETVAIASETAESDAGADLTATGEQPDAEEEVDIVGGDSVEAPVYRSSIKRRYKIQEVIKRNQIMLIQVGKEERGNKGAAVTSYISLPGRYCVLMPNSPRGGGVSRKVSNAKDRQRLKVILRELNVPEGMSVILRTAGVSRSKAEIKRDLDYLLRLWDQIRELTLKSTAPALIYEEGNLIKRAIRDLYRRDIDEVHVAGEEAFKAARDFMNTLMPSHVSRVQHYNENIPLFFRYQVEQQIDAIHSPTVHLKSGGYIVINPTEALVSIDVNSGRATKGRHIEETALKTNIEAAEEIARQLRLRDQGGLIVIDFIDMEDNRSNRIVEKKLRDAMQNDRARIQLGRISAFGLLELSRQRLHPSLVETNFETCKHCSGTGLVRTIETSAVLLLRAIEEEAMKGRAAEIRVNVQPDIALYIFNQKRDMLSALEQRYKMRVVMHADATLHNPNFTLEVGRASGTPVPDGRRPQRHAPVQTVDISDLPEISEDEITDDRTVAEDVSDEDGDEHRGPRHERGGQGRDGNDRGRGRNRRGGRGRDHRNGGRDHHQHHRGDRSHAGEIAGDAPVVMDENAMSAREPVEGDEGGFDRPPQGPGGDRNDGRNRRRGRRGGRRRGGRDRNNQERGARDGGVPNDPAFAEQPPAPHAVRQYSGNTDATPPSPSRGENNAPARETHFDAREDGGGDDAQAASGGSRKGWWKRLTE